jgi:hypothetical protein
MKRNGTASPAEGRVCGDLSDEFDRFHMLARYLPPATPTLHSPSLRGEQWRMRSNSMAGVFRRLEGPLNSAFLLYGPG